GIEWLYGNDPEGLIAYSGILPVGEVAVPAYTTNTVEDHRHILHNSGAKFAIVSTEALTQHVIAAAQGLRNLSCIITIDADVRSFSALKMIGWNDVLAVTAGGEISECASTLGPDDLACIM